MDAKSQEKTNAAVSCLVCARFVLASCRKFSTVRGGAEGNAVGRNELKRVNLILTDSKEGGHDGRLPRAEAAERS